MLPFQPAEESSWIERIRRTELMRCAVTLNKLATNIALTGDYISPNPPILAKLISEIAKILIDKILYEIPTSELEQVNAFLGEITSNLRYVERAKVTQTPWSIVQPAEKLLRLITDPNSLFIIRPTWAYNYSLTSEFWGSYRYYLSSRKWFPLDELREKVKISDDLKISDDHKIYCLSFPRIERLNCLLHANWGHEVGHILAKRWIDTEFNNAWAAAESAIKAKIEAVVRKNPPPFEPLFKDMAIQNIVAQEMNVTLKAAQQGLIELLCDRVGVHLFGPSALASTIEFAARFALDVSPLQAGDYPPWRYRIRKMVEFCKQDLDEHNKTGYPNDILKPFVDWLRIGRRLAASNSDLEVLKAKIVTDEAYNFIENQWETASDAVIDMLPHELSKPYRLQERFNLVTDLVSRIENDIPPNEPTDSNGKPASLQDILCSAWAFKIRRSSFNPNWGDDDEYSLLFRLVLKACESSYVYSEWKPIIEKVDS